MFHRTFAKKVVGILRYQRQRHSPFSQQAVGKRIVVSGASKGIGLEFTRQYLLEHPQNYVIALSRSQSDGLKAMMESYKDRLTWVSADLSNQQSLVTASEQIKQKFSNIDILLNVAGVLGDGQGSNGPERSLQQMNLDWMKHSFDTNLFGHVILTQQLLPLLKKSPKEEELSKIINLSAKVGSISDNK